MIRWILVLWPSFLVAGVAETLFFTLVNPRELYLFGDIVAFSPLATYSIGFFGFWVLCAASSLLTLYLVEKPDNGVQSRPAATPTADPSRGTSLQSHHPAHG
jgi:hypothetical protein